MKTIIVRSVLCAHIIMLGFLALAPASPAYAATTPPATTVTIQETPPPSVAPDLIITSIAGSSLPQYIELYNQGDAAFHIAGWSVNITMHDTAVAPGCADAAATISLPDGWLLSKKYLTLERTAAPNPGSLTSPFALDAGTLLAGCVSPKLASLSLAHGSDEAEQVVSINLNGWSATNTTVAQHKQRSNASSSTRNITGVFDTDYKIVTGAITLNSDPLYAPPADVAGLQILEILPNAKSCSPLDTDPTCNDYIKLFNPTDRSINLALYRLRSGAKGQSESVTNTFTWGKELDPSNDEFLLPAGQYFMLTVRNDGQPLSITDTGNFVWLEDAFGTIVYEPITAYPDASSTTRVGQAWAYDGTSWQWTSAPQPGAANYFPPVVVPQPQPSTDTAVSIESTPKPCAEGQFRNPATNRCNTIVTAAATVYAPCDEGEERNPATHRCRSIVEASAELTPCPAGEERNPATNRCRQIAAVAGGATTAVAVKDVAAPIIDRTGWYVAAGAVLLAVGYAAYEWRQEIQLAAYRIRNHLPGITSRWRR